MQTQELSLSLIHQGLRNKTLSAEALMHACADNYAKYEPQLHAYKTWNGPVALDQARASDTLLGSGIDLGPLMGIPVSVKDLFAVPGMPTFAGTSERLPARWEQPGDVIQTLLRQLALITGKTHTVEFAFGGIGMNTHWGTPVNPWDASDARIPGGSSSGAGVSLSQGSAMLALGTDTAGSVRIPASLTGNVALKLTQERWPGTGIVPLSSTLDTPGILTRSVEDAIFAFDAIESMLSGKSVRIPTLESLHHIRIGVPDNFFWSDVEPEIIEAVEACIKKLETYGAIVRRVTLPGCDEVYEMFQAGGLGASELSAFLHATMPEKIEKLDPMVQIRIEGADAISSVDYLRRCHLVRQASQTAAEFFSDVDVLVTPTLATSAPKIADLQNTDAYRHANMMVLRNPSIANLMGLCGLTMPIAKDRHGIPVGLQLMGGPNDEERLLAISAFIEQKLGKPSDVLGTPPLII